MKKIATVENPVPQTETDLMGEPQTTTAKTTVAADTFSSKEIADIVAQNKARKIGDQMVYNGEEVDQLYIAGIYQGSIVACQPQGRGTSIKVWSRFSGYSETLLMKDDLVNISKIMF